ncbi:hypothetical protein QJS04_geneDACA000493 [Acorus gramineus]|uniref:Expansin-like CBD domain-containing protein n=1 Tax=Acorus gramineus TaxID=55184 RepID=A0AAV9AQM9_ACOGR|nr:hypothetical protein QJS04_geneDACA000493 [Acorus gramineus]
MIANVGGSGDVKAAWIKTARGGVWKAMRRNWGVNWQSDSDLLRNQALSFRIALMDGQSLEFANVKSSGQTYASRDQF